MSEVTLRPYEPRDSASILKLNYESVHVLSPLNEERFSSLRAMASIIWVAEFKNEVVAFLMGFCDGEDYDSVHYRWFSTRLKNFLYVDRIVVGEKVRSLGIGQKFYAEIGEWATKQGLKWLVAEIDLDPPNEASLKFHDMQQFVEIAQLKHVNENKVVSIRLKSIGV